MIAVDAADSRLVRQWASEGHLPTIAGLLASGLSTRIATPLAVVEGGIWPTFLTTSSPATHGLFSYYRLVPGTYEIEIGMHADRLPVPPFWTHLSRAGKRVAVIDAPFARPLPGLNGIQVTNWGAHDAWSWKRSSWPPRLIGDLVKRFGEHPVATCDVRNRTLGDYEDLRAHLISGVQQKAALLRHCLEMEEWDFFLGVFSESHCAGHQMWHLTDPDHPLHPPQASPTLRSAIRDVYAAIDGGIGTVLEAVHPDTHVVLMLTHGMGPYYAGSHLLQAVIDRLAGNDGGGASAKRGPAASRVDSHSWRRRLWGARRLLPGRLRGLMKSRLRKPVSTLWRWANPESMPWPTMRAFAVPSHNMTGAIRINLEGREPAGLVKPGRPYDDLCRELTEGLLALENAETGRPAVQWVARAADLYQGPRLGEMPDLFVEWDHTAMIRSLRSDRIGTVSGMRRGWRTGDHRQGGLLVARGPRFAPREIEAEVRTQDLAPTVLDLLGVSSPPEYEGRSLLPSLRQPSLAPSVP